VTHDAEVAEAGDRVVRMRDGRIEGHNVATAGTGACAEVVL
jgi:ABC-type lipoprotein export system ATPase subunit